MFVIDPAPHFEASVELATLNGPAVLSCTFLHRRISDLAALQRQITAGELDDVGVLLQILQAWDAQNADGSAVPVGEAGIRALLDGYPYAAGAIWTAYIHALQRGRLGN